MFTNLLLRIHVFDLIFFKNFRQLIVRAQNLRTTENYIPAMSFRARKVYFNNEVRVSEFLFLFIYL